MIDALIRFIEARLDPFADQPEAGTEPPRDAYRFGRWTLWPMRGLLIAYALLSLSIGVIEVAIIQMVGGLVDLAADGPERFFAEHWGYLLAVLALAGLARPLAVSIQGGLTSLGLNPWTPQAAIWRLHRHALGHGLGYFHDDFAGRLAQKEMQAGAALYDIVFDSINAFGMMAAFALGMAIAYGAAHPLLAVPAVLWIGGYGALLRVMLPRIRRAARRRADVRAGVTGQLVDSFTNIVTVKLFAHGAREEEAAREALTTYRGASFAFGREVTLLRLGLNVLNAALMVSVLGLALWLWRAEAGVSIGAAAAAAMLAFRATGMAGWIAFTALNVFSQVGTLEDAIRTLTPPHKITDRPNARDPEQVEGRVAFERVAFHYGRDGGVIDGLSLEIAPGEKVGLVGPSGAGKSTLVSLLLRLYDVEGGRVAIDGRDVRDFTQDGLRRAVGVIAQETAMFNRSALENIRYGRPEASEAEAIAAAKQARADEFIRDLRDGAGREGYAARLGERGVKLSGGQRQRIALARAILKDAPIMILDEATSALDSEVEAEILDALYRMMEGRTALAIAHRLSTIARMDRIAAMEGGRIVECGTHEELLAHGGLYARLWARQSGGFLDLAAE